MGVESEEGRGSNFWSTIRLKTRPEDPTSRVKPDEFEGLRVLVASGHATQRQILEDQLRAWGVHADSAADCASALEKVGQAAAIRPYKLILVDLDIQGTDGIQLARSVRALPEVPLTRTVLLSATNAISDPEVLRQAGIAQWLHKPVSQRELHRCLRHTIAGRSALPDEDDRSTSPDQSSAYFGAHVLVAEDNPVNQEVARGMLEALGCQVEIVPSGADAVMAAAAGRYGMIFMDCQMPDMDGFEATRRIRASESSGRIPIIALTANAIAGDRERCLESGMDDYLAKPISQQQLADVMRQYLEEVEPPERAALEEPATPAPTQMPEDGPIDFAAVESIRQLERAGGRKLLATVIQTYLDNAPELVEEIRAGIDKGDAHSIERAAHQFKSASANLGAHKLASICKELEELGRSGSTRDTDKLLADVEAEYGPVSKALEVELEKSR
jgi:CheY-like chemotaxis protein/HPt (histidine-containing phosphotransfer) domain-containing protein